MPRYLGSGLIVLLGSGLLLAPSQAGSIRVGHRISAAAREREITRNEAYYKNIVSLRAEEPARFDHARPFYAQLFTDPAFFARIFQRWQSHPTRFEFYHPCTWKVLDGGSHTGTLTPPGTPTPPGTGGSTPVPPSIPQESIPPVPPIPPPPIPPLPPPEAGPLPPSVVPEPSSMMLVATGMGLLLARAGLRLRRG